VYLNQTYHQNSLLGSKNPNFICNTILGKNVYLADVHFCCIWLHNINLIVIEQYKTCNNPIYEFLFSGHFTLFFSTFISEDQSKDEWLVVPFFWRSTKFNVNTFSMCAEAYNFWIVSWYTILEKAFFCFYVITYFSLCGLFSMSLKGLVSKHSGNQKLCIYFSSTTN
jgi:hypothetical protein